MQLPKCHASNPENPAPAKHNQKSEVECCKVLRATLLVASSSLVAGDTLSFAPYIYVLRFIPAADQSQLGRLCEWDTGHPERLRLLNRFFSGAFSRTLLLFF